MIVLFSGGSRTIHEPAANSAVRPIFQLILTLYSTQRRGEKQKIFFWLNPCLAFQYLRASALKWFCPLIGLHPLNRFSDSTIQQTFIKRRNELAKANQLAGRKRIECHPRFFGWELTQKIVSFGLFVISSISMKLIPSYKIMVLLLLLTFLTASVGNVFGYAWCVGDDGHVGIDSVADKGCCIDVCKSDYIDGSYDTSAISLANEYCRQCLDFSAPQAEAVFFKRLKRIPTVSKVAVNPNGFPQIAVQNVKRVAGNLMLEPQPRISQTILAHRTVVMRN